MFRPRTCSRSAAIVFAMATLVADSSAVTQEPSKLEPKSLEASAQRTANPEVFGHEIARQILLAAAQMVRTRRLDSSSIMIELPVRVSTLPNPFLPPRTELPRVPGPGEIDVCYEMCPRRAGESFLQCYVSCTSPVHIQPLPRGGIPLLRTCQAIRAAYTVTTDRVQRLEYLVELIQDGCVRPDQVSCQLSSGR
jgi:hypothetical protein